MNFARAKALLACAPGMGTPIAHRLLSGGVWSLVGDAGSRALGFLSAIFVARALGVTDYGAFALVQSTLGMLTIFAAFGLGQTSTRYIAANRISNPERIGGIAALTLAFSVATGMAAALAMYAAAPFLAARMLAAPELEIYLRFVAPVLLLYAVSGTFGGLVLGFERFQAMARVTWVTAVCAFVAVLGGVWSWGLAGAVTGLVMGEVVRCVLSAELALSTMRKNGFNALRWVEWSEARVLWRFSLPILLGAALHAPVLWLCQAMIARQIAGMSEIGLYDVAQKWMTVVILAPFAASAAFGPVLASLSGGDRSAYRKTTVGLAKVQFVLTAGPAALVTLAAPWALQVFGASFEAASAVLPVMMMLAPIFVLKHLYWQALTGGGYAWTALGLAVLWALVAISLTWLWQGSGAVGLAWAMLGAYGAALAASVVLVERIWRQDEGKSRAFT